MALPHSQSPDSREQELQAPVSVSAILTLAELRLQQVERVLGGEEDPQHLWARHNGVTPKGGTGFSQQYRTGDWPDADGTAQVNPKKFEATPPPGTLLKMTGPCEMDL